MEVLILMSPCSGWFSVDRMIQLSDMLRGLLRPQPLLYRRCCLDSLLKNGFDCQRVCRSLHRATTPGRATTVGVRKDIENNSPMHVRRGRSSSKLSAQ